MPISVGERKTCSGQGPRVAAHIFNGLLASLLALPLAPMAQADDEHPPEPLLQRNQFLAAKKALEQGDAKTFMQMAVSLKDYPLYPYLTYWHLRNNLSEQSNSTIQAFIDSHDDTPLASQLRVTWLRKLAHKKRWQDYLSFYKGSNRTDLRCYAHLAELKTGNRSAAWAGAKELWLVGYSQPKACDPLFDAWERAGGISRDLRWQRIEMAMGRGKSGLAEYLARPLDEETRRQVALWRRVENQPERITSDEPELRKDNAMNRRIIMHGLIRLAKRDHIAAASLWKKVKNRYAFTAYQQQLLHKKIAYNFAFDGDSRALKWFAKVPEKNLTASNSGWAVRTALRQRDWRTALEWIDRVPKSERSSEQWRYWKARAHEALGQKEEARKLYRNISASRSYYGFLAADRSGNPYNLSHETLQVNDEMVSKLERKPGLRRAHELYHLGLTQEARQEWEYAVSKMNREERLAAGKLADAWQWHDRALLTLAKARHFDDLNIRFPLAYHKEVTQEAGKRGLDPAWVYAVARQESAFIEDVRSSAGALGLMQLMPGTGKMIAQELNTRVKTTDLLQPETNIRFGSYYLHQVLDRFNNNPVMATAAYNAGPHRVEKWKPRRDDVDADVWVDTIPFHETRQYVRRVMAYSVFYDQRLERPVKRLRERMPRVDKHQ